MCNYKYQKKRSRLENAPCLYPEFYNKHSDRFLKITELPIDEQGYCIFHSKDVLWKNKNGFTEMFGELLEVLKNTKGDQKGKLICNFSGFCFCSKSDAFILENYLPEGELDFSFCEFKSGFKVKNSKYSSIDFDDSFFHKILSITDSSFINNVDCSRSKFINGVVISNCKFDGYSYFTNCTFASGENSNASFSFKNCPSVQYLSFEHSRFEISVVFDYVAFDQEVVFNHVTFLDEFYFHHSEINGVISFNESEFFLSENVNPMHSSVDFNNITIRKTGKLTFKGKKALDNVVHGEFQISFKEEPLGVILFENFNLNKIFTPNKLKLFELEKSGNVEIGKGCRKYYCQTDIIIIETSNSNQKLIIDIVTVFCNYFEIQNGYNLGIEIVERNKESIKYFYFTDELISKEDFLGRIKQNENSLWETFANFSKSGTAVAFKNDIEVKNCLIDLAGFFLKIGNLIDHKSLKEGDFTALFNSIALDGASSIDTRSFFHELISRQKELSKYIPNVIFINQSNYFVEPSRIEELRAIKSQDFDLTKLIRLCEELNYSYATDNNFSSSLLMRSIIDHIPTIFGADNFKMLANNYKTSSRSFKSAMHNLDTSLRNIADINAHSQIRKTEVLPKAIQINFQAEIDLLLSEIVRNLKNS